MNEQKQEGALAEGARRANGAKAPGHRSERGRFSCQRKRAALKARPADERDEENARLKAKVGELTMEGEVLREKIDRLEAGRPLAGRRWRR